MNVLNPALPFLTASELIGMASSLDALHTRTLKAIERLQKDVDTRKREVANRWKGTSHLLADADRLRIEIQEIRVAILAIKQNAEKELDAILKEAGETHRQAVSQRPFYDSPVKTLNRITLGDAKRSEYMRQIESIGPAELTHLAQFAVSTKNSALAAAIVSRLDGVKASSRPISAVSLAIAMELDEHRKGSEAIKIADVRLQGIVVAIRTWKAGTSNPISTVALAMQTRDLDSEVLKELEVDDAAA
jgi:hypothetical protein